jgi:hypothetical protein
MKKILIGVSILLTLLGCQNKNPAPQVNANPPNNLSLSYDQSKILVAGICSDVQNLTILDVYGKPTLAVADQTIHLNSSAPTVKFFSDYSCTNEISVVKVKTGASSSSFYIQDSATGYFSYSATTSNITADSQSHVSVSPYATQISFLGPSVVEAGKCSPGFSVTAKNYAGEISTVTEDTSISFSNIGLGKFYLTADCTDVGGSTAAILTGNSSVNVYFKAPKVGGYNITATAPGPVTNSSYTQVKAGVPNKMAFLTSPQTVVAGNCSGSYIVQYQDINGNPTAFTSDTPINLTGAGLTFFTDASCSSASVSTITVPANSTNGNFYISATLTTSNLVTISGVGTDQNQSINVSPGNSSKIYLPALATAITAGAPFSRINAQVQDQYGNIVTGFNRLYALTAFTDSLCTNPAVVPLSGITQVTTSGAASFIGINYTKSGTIYIGASSAGLTKACSGPIVVNPDFASKLSISGLPSLKVGDCSSAFNVNTTDQYGNQSTVTSNATITLGGQGGGLFYASADCSGNPSTQVTLPSNTPFVNFYFKGLTVEGLILSASGVGSATSTYPISVVAGDPSKIAFYSPASMTAGLCVGGFTVKLLDSYGNNANALAPLNIDLSQNGNALFYTDSTCLNSVLSLSVSKGSTSKQFFVKDLSSESLRIDVQSLSYDYKILTVNPAGASQLSFISVPASVTAGSILSAVKVGIQDSNGNLLINSTNSVSVTAYSDVACSVELTTQVGGTRTKTASGSLATFSDLNYPVATGIYLGASSGTLTKACSTMIQITPSNAAQLALKSSQASPVAGTCSSIDVISQDNQGNASPASADTLVMLSTSGQAVFYSTNDCSGAAIQSTQINQGSSFSRVYLKDNKAENITLSSSNSSFVPGSLLMTIKESTAVKLAIAGPSTIIGGKCVGYSVQSLDSYNNLSKVPAPVSVNLQSTGAGVFYSDSNCLNSVTATSVAAASNLATVYLKDSSLESINLTPSSTTLSSTALTGVVVTAGVASKLSIVGASVLTTGVCTTYQIQSLDDYGNLANVLVDTNINIADFSYGQFFTSANCSGSSVASVVLPNHLNKVTVSFIDTRSEGITFSTTATNITAATQSVVINPSAAGKIVINSSSKNVTAGICSTSIDFKLTDNSGNFVNASSNVSINLTDPNVQYYSQAGCGSAIITTTQISQGSAGVSVYAIIKKASVTTLSVSSIYGPINQPITVKPDVAAKVEFTQVPPSGIPGSNSFSVPIIVQSSDQYGNANSLFSGNVSIASFKDSTCSTPTTSPITGTIQQQFSGGISTFNGIGYGAAETIYIKSSSAGLSASCSSSISISASNPTKIEISGLSNVVAGQCSGPFTVSAKDSFNNLAKVTSGTPISFTGLGVGGSVHGSSACSDGSTNSIVTIAGNTNSKTYYLKGITAGSYIMTASSTLGNSTFPYSINPDVASSILISGPISIYSGSCNLYTLTTKDGYSNTSNLSTGKTFTLAGKASGVFYSDSSCSSTVAAVSVIAGSSAGSFYFKDSSPGESTTLTATASGFTATGALVSVQNLPPTSLQIMGSAAVTVGSCNPYVISLLDSSNQSTTSTTATAVAFTGAGTGAFYTDSGCISSINSTTINSGQNGKTVYFKDAIAESVILSVSGSGLSSGIYPITVNTGAPTSIKFRVQPQATTTAGASLNSISAYYVDQFDNLIFTQNPISVAVLNSDNSAGPTLFGTLSVAPDDSTGLAVFSDLSIQKAGSFFLQASGTSVTGKSSALIITPAAVSSLTKVSGDNQSGLFNTQLNSPLFVIAKDQYSNVITGASIKFDPLASGGSFNPSGSILTGIDGKASAVFTAGSSVSGTISLKAYVTTNATISTLFSETIIGVKKLALSGPTSVIKGACAGPFTIQTLDQSSNPITTTIAINTNLSATDGGVSFYSDAACGTSSPSPIVAAGTSTKQFYIKNTSLNNFIVTDSATSITSGTLSLITYSARFSTTAINYGTTNSNQDQTLTIINDGSTLPVSLSFSGPGFNVNDFQVITNSCPANLSQGSSCSVVLRFMAGTCGKLAATSSGTISLPIVNLSASVVGTSSYTWVETANTGNAWSACGGNSSGTAYSGSCGAKCSTNSYVEGSGKTTGSCGSACCFHDQQCQ